MSTQDYDFDDTEDMKRNFDIEGITGTELGFPNGSTFIVLAATDANPRWRARHAKIRAELNRLSNANAPMEKVRHYLAGQYAECLVKGWRDVKNKGVPIDFSVEACTAYLRTVHDAYTALDKMAYESTNFRGQRVEAIKATAGE